jgi:hypothetical protein
MREAENCCTVSLAILQSGEERQKVQWCKAGLEDPASIDSDAHFGAQESADGLKHTLKHIYLLI